MVSLSAIATLVASEESSILPPFVYALIAFLVFLSLAFVVWSFRDVANRHTNTRSRSNHGGGTEHH